MDKKITTLILAGAAFCIPAAAQTPAPPSADDTPMSVKIQLLKKYDKDGDGRLNEQERAEAMKAIKEKSADLDELRDKNVQDVIKKFDKDGDGKLDKSELAAFLDEQRKMFENMRARRFRNMPVPKEVLAKYDKDGDGKLSPQERRAMFEDARKRRAELVKKYDKDGDGKLSEAERAELIKDPEIQNMMKRMIGDGSRMMR